MFCAVKWVGKFKLTINLNLDMHFRYSDHLIYSIARRPKALFDNSDNLTNQTNK
jgi:hypothetical protein